MTTDPTPAVTRAAAWMYAPAVRPEDLTDVLAAWQLEAAKDSLTAALTDPDDPDFLARTLFVLYHERVMTPELALIHWNARADTHREEWRVFADGLRMMLTGSGA